MKIEIDQSGKIEHTSRPTVVAFSNKESNVLVILAKDKKAVQKYFRKIGKPKLFIYFTFMVLVYYLIENHLKKYDQIIIDREYPGYEKLISRTLKQWIKDSIAVTIAQIGKKSRAHDLAWKELKSRTHQNTSKINSNKIIKFLRVNLKSGSV